MYLEATLKQEKIKFSSIHSSPEEAFSIFKEAYYMKMFMGMKCKVSSCLPEKKFLGVLYVYSKAHSLGHDQYSCTTRGSTWILGTHAAIL